jgi:hypothetical protein
MQALVAAPLDTHGREHIEDFERLAPVPTRYIRVRNMGEEAAPGEDILATAAAIRIIGATRVETLDTPGVDDSNVDRGVPTKYGTRRALAVNSGTILISVLVVRAGIENEFRVSVVMGAREPCDRHADIVSAAATVTGVSAGHEGGDPTIERGGPARQTPRGPS